MARLLVQVGLLLRKYALILSRSPFQLILGLISPLAALLLSVVSSGAMTNSYQIMFTGTATSVSMTDPKPLPVAYPVCAAGSSTVACQRPRILYAPNDAYHAAVVAQLASDIGLSTGAPDVIAYPTLDALAADLVTRRSAIVKERPINFGVSFTTFASVGTIAGFSTGSVPLFNNIPADLGSADARIRAANGTHYTIWPVVDDMVTYSYSGDAVLPNIVYSSHDILFKHALDKAILKTRSSMLGVPNPAVDVSLSHFALPAEPGSQLSEMQSSINSFAGQFSQSMGNALTAAFIVLGFAPLMLIMANLVGYEKYTGLLGVLRKLGMTESALWIATFLTVVIMCTASSLIALLAIPAFPLRFPLYNWDPLVVFVVMLLSGFHLVSTGLIFVAALNGQYSINIFAGMLAMLCIAGSAVFGMLDGTSLATLHPGSSSAYEDLFKTAASGWAWNLLPFITVGKLVFEMQTMVTSANITVHLSAANMTVARQFIDNSVPVPYSWSSPSTAATMGIMVIYPLLFFCICGYINQVVGGPHPLWFPFTASYWGLGAEPNADIHKQTLDSDELRVENLAVTFTPVRFGCFPTNRPIKAVKDVSLRVRKGRVLSLLGTNGAGKSTTINAITGLLRPTSGVVSCFGTGRLDKIQQMIGVTPQSDLTWPLLTAAEHVKMFAAFKDVQGNLDQYAVAQLAKVGLETKGDQLVGQFSGGMRRRTAILLAGVGEPPLVVLDEPTASLDPINRRKIWAFISSLKSHAAVILTTHLLDEADALGDEVCIIDSGEVKATGTSLALKTKYGSGYEVLLLAQEGQTLESVTELVHAHAPAAVVSRRSAEMFAATIPRDRAVVPLLRFLQSNDSTRVAVIREWEVANSTLEQVFLTLAEQAKAEREAAAAAAGDGPKADHHHDANVTQAELAPFEMPKFDGHPTLARQVMASFLKNWTYQLKQLKATIFLFATTVLVLGFFVYGLSMAQEQLCAGGYIAVPESTASGGGSDFYSSNSDPSSRGPKTCNLVSLTNQVVKGMGLCSPGASFGCFEGDWQLPPQFQVSGSTTASSSSRNTARYWVSDPSSAAGNLFAPSLARNWSDLGQSVLPVLSAMGSSSSASGLAPYYINQLPSQPPNVTVVTQPQLVASLIKAHLGIMYAAAQPLPVNCAARYSNSIVPKVYITQDEDVHDELTRLLPDYGAELQQFDLHGTKVQLIVLPIKYDASDMLSIYKQESSYCSSTRPSIGGINPTIFNALQYLTSAVLTGVWTSGTGSIGGGSNDVIHELLQSVMNAQTRVSFASASPGESIHGRIQSPPQVGTPQATPAIAVFTIPMALLLLIAAYLSIAFYEKEAKLFQYYRTNGLSVPAYWLGMYLFSLTFSVPSLVFAVILAAWKIPTMNLGQFIVVALIHIHCTIGMGFLLASVTSSVVMARLVAFLFAPAAAVIAGALTIQNSHPSLAAALFPPIQFATNLQNLIVTAAVDWGLAGLSFVVGTAYMAMSIGLLTLVEWHPWQSLVSKVLGKRGGDGEGRAKLVDAEVTDPAFDSEDLEVRKERHDLDGSVADPELAKRYAIRAIDIDKNFGKQSVLKGMYMSAKNGETYGLLGHNGCGKTTLLDILTGESRPTRGNAWVAGALTTTGRSHIAASVGVCPQNDMVVGDLTVIENLRFFARLRGAPMLGAPLEALVKRCAELIGLSTHLDRPASALSGGQRRRLQVGVAVIGSPQVILADEPSAGLDPANRLGIWKLLGRIRESGETAVVITTHSMAEADALCTRIGIVAGGRMRALGNQVALRARYGLGNSVQMQLPITAVAAEPPHELAARVMDAETAAIHGLTTKLELALKLGIHLKVNHELLDSAAAQRARGGTWDLVAKTWAWEVRVQVLFPPGTDLASVFEAMTSGSIGVQDWAISQSSLEDVFIRVSNQYYQS